MTPRLFLSLSPVLGLLVLHLLSVGSTTPTIVDKRTITDVDKCTKELCTGNTTCDWALLWTNQSLCFLLKCPTIDDCRNATVQDLLATPFPIDTHPTRTSTVVQTEDPKALNLQPNLGSQDSVSQSQEISAEPKQTNETVDNPQLTLASDNNTSDSEQLKPTMTTIAKPTADVTEKVSLTTSATATSTAPPSPATNSTTAPPLKTTTKVTALTSIVSTLPSASTISTPKLKANSTQTSPTPTTTTSTTTTTTPPAPTTLTTLPQTISSSTSTPPPQLPVTTQTITITAETAPPPTTPKILTPPSASEKPTAFPTSPEALTKGLAGSTNKTIVGITVGPFSVRLVDTSSLLAVLLFGLLFFVVTVVLFLTQAYESYRRKDYTQVDYLINGMYSDSGV